MRAGKIEALRRIATESVHPGEREAARRALDRESEKVHDNLKGGIPKSLEDILDDFHKTYGANSRNDWARMYRDMEDITRRAYESAANASRGMPKAPATKFTGRNAIFMAEMFAIKVRTWMTNNLSKAQVGYYNFNLNSAVEDITAAVRSGAAFTALQIRKTIINFTFGDANLGQHDLVDQEAAV